MGLESFVFVFCFFLSSLWGRFCWTGILRKDVCLCGSLLSLACLLLCACACLPCACVSLRLPAPDLPVPVSVCVGFCLLWGRGCCGSASACCAPPSLGGALRCSSLCKPSSRKIYDYAIFPPQIPCKDETRWKHVMSFQVERASSRPTGQQLRHSMLKPAEVGATSS